jgi:hypothetical protein
MYRNLFLLLLAAFLLAPSPATAVLEEEDFKVEQTEDLLDLCSTSPDNPLYQGAIHFCHGYLVGAYHYYTAVAAGPDGTNLVCFPDPPPSRETIIAMFIEWAKAHPEYMNELPVETEFRFLMEKWPCTK